VAGASQLAPLRASTALGVIRRGNVRRIKSLTVTAPKGATIAVECTKRMCRAQTKRSRERVTRFPRVEGKRLKLAASSSSADGCDPAPGPPGPQPPPPNRPPVIPVGHAYRLKTDVLHGLPFYEKNQAYDPDGSIVEYRLKSANFTLADYQWQFPPAGYPQGYAVIKAPSTRRLDTDTIITYVAVDDAGAESNAATVTIDWCAPHGTGINYCR